MKINFEERPIVAFNILEPGDIFYDFREAEYCMVIDNIENKYGNGVCLRDGIVQHYDPSETVIYPIEYNFTIKRIKYAD